MGLIVDTSVLIAVERQRLGLAALFNGYPEEPFFLAAITVSELLHGVARADSKARMNARSEFVENVLSTTDSIDFDGVVARRHAQLWAKLEKSGKMIGAHDLLIAATALHYSYPVITLNVEEFRQVPGLDVIDGGRFLKGSEA
jgi:predicted nucleic acid-binding protein